MSRTIGKYEFTDVTEDFQKDSTYGLLHLTPSIVYRHKYWYLWEIEFIFWKWSKRIEICRTDWNQHQEKDEKWFWKKLKKNIKK